MKNKRVLLCSAIFLFVAGCSSIERSMSGKIGCPSEQIQILETSPGWGIVSTTWKVQCHNRVYVCSLRPHAQEINDLNDMDCSLAYAERRSSRASL